MITHRQCPLFSGHTTTMKSAPKLMYSTQSPMTVLEGENATLQCIFSGRLVLTMNSASTMMTSSNGHIFLVNGPLWGESTGHRWITPTKASDTELWCFLDLHPNKRFSKRHRAYYDVTLIWSCPILCCEIQIFVALCKQPVMKWCFNGHLWPFYVILWINNTKRLCLSDYWLCWFHVGGFSSVTIRPTRLRLV